MKKQGIWYKNLCEKKLKNRKSFAILLDPDAIEDDYLTITIQKSIAAGVDYFFIGGSLVMSNRMDEIVLKIKSSATIPVILFPGSPAQLSQYADGLLYLSLISGRNPELLIGQHVLSAATVKASGIEVIPTGYIVVDGGAPTSVSYMSNTAPIPADKNDIAMCTALAGELLGMQVIYMDAGSGAKTPISSAMIQKINANISIPIIVGGGICTPEKAIENCKAGADIIVIGNAIEKDILLIEKIAHAIHHYRER